MSHILPIVGSTVAGYLAGPALVDLALRAKFPDSELARDLARGYAHAQYDLVASIAVSVGAYLLLGVML